MKKFIFMALFIMIMTGLNVYGQNTNLSGFFLDPNTNDVIVRKGKTFYGFQANIKNVDDKRIYYGVKTMRGVEKDKKINLSRVAFTISFNKESGLVPTVIPMQDFMSLPVFYNGLNLWVTYGPQSGNLDLVSEFYPDIKKDFVKGVRLTQVSGMLFSLSYFLGVLPAVIAGGIIGASGENKINNAFTIYYDNCFDMDVCNKYGIVITPYNTSLNFNRGKD